MGSVDASPSNLPPKALHQQECEKNDIRLGEGLYHLIAQDPTGLLWAATSLQELARFSGAVWEGGGVGWIGESGKEGMTRGGFMQ